MTKPLWARIPTLPAVPSLTPLLSFLFLHTFHLHPPCTSSHFPLILLLCGHDRPPQQGRGGVVGSEFSHDHWVLRSWRLGTRCFILLPIKWGVSCALSGNSWGKEEGTAGHPLDFARRENCELSLCTGLIPSVQDWRRLGMSGGALLIQSQGV